MAVYVDDARHALGRMIMGHMLADTLDELHGVAEAIGMKRSWYQPTSFPHYGVSVSRRVAAVALGAITVDRRGIVAVKRRLRACPAFTQSVRRHHRASGLDVPGWAEMENGRYAGHEGDSVLHARGGSRADDHPRGR